MFHGFNRPKEYKIYVHDILPMGARNFPGVSGSFGAAFLRFVIDKLPMFQEDAVDNSVIVYFTKKVYHLEHKEG